MDERLKFVGRRLAGEPMAAHGRAMSESCVTRFQGAMIEGRRGYFKAENLPATVRRFKRESEPMTFNIGTRAWLNFSGKPQFEHFVATGGN